MLQDQMLSHTHANLLVKSIVNMPHAPRGDRHGQKKLLSANNQTPNYDTECSNQQP